MRALQSSAGWARTRSRAISAQRTRRTGRRACPSPRRRPAPLWGAGRSCATSRSFAGPPRRTRLGGRRLRLPLWKSLKTRKRKRRTSRPRRRPRVARKRQRRWEFRQRSAKAVRRAHGLARPPWRAPREQRHWGALRGLLTRARGWRFRLSPQMAESAANAMFKKLQAMILFGKAAKERVDD